MRLLFAGVTTTVAGCSIWAALDNPYKSDPSATVDGAVSDGRAADGPSDAAPRDTGPPRRTIDAGYYALAAHGDTVYAVDPQAQVHVAYDASTNFVSFFAGDGGDTFLLDTNGIAATATTVYWTVSGGVHACAVDGGQCAFLASTTGPRDIAAGGSVVAWIDSAGVKMCPGPLSGCSPTTLAASKGAASLTVGPTGAIAWTDGGASIHVVDSLGGNLAVSFPYDVALVASDAVTGSLCWVGQMGLGTMQFDGGGAQPYRLTEATKPIELFAARGVLYWSLRNVNANVAAVSYCRVTPEAGCFPTDLTANFPASMVPTATTDQGIVSTSRDVLTVLSSDVTAFPPQLVVWRLSP